MQCAITQLLGITVSIDNALMPILVKSNKILTNYYLFTHLVITTSRTNKKVNDIAYRSEFLL